MPKAKSRNPNRLTAAAVVPTTDTEAGIQWLYSLPETEFRDKVLKDLLRRMQKAGVIEWFENIHGRNEKGVDYLVVERTPLGQRVVGIQVKSKRITRSGDASSLSALDVRNECHSAIYHEFDVQQSKARLDNVALWCSAHITEDAEKEINPIAATVKIQVLKATQIFSLIEKYCSDMIQKLPQCGLSSYLVTKRNPEPKQITLLGCRLNPRQHFLEPHFSKQTASSTQRISIKNSTVTTKQENISVRDLIKSNRHILVVSGELSGKSYLLDHAEYLVADANMIPVLVRGKEITHDRFSSVYHLISQYLKFYTPRDVEALVDASRIVLLVDDFDALSADVQQSLCAADPERIKVLATARSSVPAKNTEAVFMVGVNLACIPRFLRALDIDEARTANFTDRAHSFLTRCFWTSGLPNNPFIISMMLNECHASHHKFNTPTMGRLIERFVETQLESHSEFRSNVDFETKRAFLTQLAGQKANSMSIKDFQRRLLRYIGKSDHPHSLIDFTDDLIRSGVFTLSHDGTEVQWSHPVIKQYFWVKNLVAKGKLKPIISILRNDLNTTLAALVGSQLGNGRQVVEPLLDDLKAVAIPKETDVLDAARGFVLQDPFLNDEQEEKLLADIEKDEPQDQPPTQAPSHELTKEEKAALRKKLDAIMQRFVESKFHIAYNVAATLVNARDTSAQLKQTTVRAVMARNTQLGDLLERLIIILDESKKRKAFLAGWGRIYYQLQLTDDVLGDPFLVSVFERLVKQPNSDDELLMVLDLLLCCGEEQYDLILRKLREIDKPEVTFAFYFRIVLMYFFRFHRPREKAALRDLLKNLRKVGRALVLPQVATT